MVDIIKHFVANHPLLDGLYILASERSAGARDEYKKRNLYQAYIKKQLNQLPGFGVDTYRQGFIITKTK